MAHAGRIAADALTWVSTGKRGEPPDSLRDLTPSQRAAVTRAAAEVKNAIRAAAGRAAHHH